MDAHTPTRQLPARELAARGIVLPYWHDDLDKQVTYHMTVLILPMEVIDRIVVAGRKHIAEHSGKRFHANLDYPVVDRERVNLIRHSLLNRTERNMHQPNGYHGGYDNLLERITKKGVDVEARQLELKRHILSLIATHYPALKLECEYQLWQFQTKQRRTQ